MDRELLIEIGCEEIPASWLPALTEQLRGVVDRRLGEFRLKTSAPAETFSTPRRLAVRVAKVAERQDDLEELVTGPPVGAAYGADGQPTPAALGFARKQGVAFGDLTKTTTPKGEYLAYNRRQRGRAAVDVLGDVLAAVLRDLSFPKAMHWDAELPDGRGELLFGRPIRWLLFLFGGRVVQFTIGRSALARGPLVQDVDSEALTYGHRFLATTGRPGRSIKVRHFDEYKAKLAEHFVILDRDGRRDRIRRELELHARRLGGRVQQGHGALLDEVPDLVEYPSVVAGTFDPAFLELPQEVLTTTMIHHQHYFPVVDPQGALKPAFLAVTNADPQDGGRAIATNAERVLTARLRDARFFWDADRRTRLEDRLERLDTVVFHKKAGSYRDKARRVETLARWIVTDVLKRPDQAEHAATAARLAKVDLTTDMVREFTELQGVMGGLYARQAGQPEPVWKAIYYQYLPVGVDADAPPTRAELGEAAVAWAAVSLADKLDTQAQLFYAGEEPKGSRDPFGLRRQAHGVVKVLTDLEVLTGLGAAPSLSQLLAKAWPVPGSEITDPYFACIRFLHYRLRHLLRERDYRADEIEAAMNATGPDAPKLVAARASALRSQRSSEDFLNLAVLFKRVKNIAREISPQPLPQYPARFRPELASEPAEKQLQAAWVVQSMAISDALRAGDYGRALTEASQLRKPIDRFFNEVFVMVEQPELRTNRLMLMVSIRDLILEIADIAQIGEEVMSLE